MLCNITQNAMGQTPGGYPYPIMLCNITQNSMEQTPGGVPCQVQQEGYPAGVGTLLGVPCQGKVPCWGVPPVLTWPTVYPGRVPQQGTSHPGQVRMGEYPVRTTEGVLTTRRVVCLLRSHRRTFLFLPIMSYIGAG